MNGGYEKIIFLPTQKSVLKPSETPQVNTSFLYIFTDNFLLLRDVAAFVFLEKWNLGG